MNGFLLIDKPKEWTSFDAVAKVRGIVTKYYKQHPELISCEQCEYTLNERLQDGGDAEELRIEIFSTPVKHRHKIRVGHAGTLDPAATGLLILAVGRATKKIDGLMKRDKSYDVELTLGATSNTDDQEGEIVLTEGATEITDKDLVNQAVMSFVGEIEQVPPIYSAIKIDGKRAYKLARAGETPEMKPRPATIRSIEHIAYNHPKVTFVSAVSSGTYIRALARDIGEKLEIGAYMSELRRTTIGDFSVQNALGIEEVSIETIQEALIPLEKLFKTQP